MRGRLRRTLTGTTVTIVVMALGFIGLRAFISSRQAPTIGVQQDQLAPCPDADNCVWSRSGDPRHAIEPYSCPDAPLSEVVTVIERTLARSEVVRLEDGYAHITDRSRWLGFIDDLELLEQGDEVQVRSASRLGRGDLGVNRARVERIREALRAADICE